MHAQRKDSAQLHEALSLPKTKQSSLMLDGMLGVGVRGFLHLRNRTSQKAVWMPLTRSPMPPQRASWEHRQRTTRGRHGVPRPRSRVFSQPATRWRAMASSRALPVAFLAASYHLRRAPR